MRTREGGSKGGGGFIWARNSSPCGTVSSRKREKVRPARSKHPKFGVFVRAGRDFSRKGRWRAVLGELCRADWHCARVSEAERLPPCRQWWGFCTTRGLLVACRRRVGPSCSAIPPAAQCRIRFCVHTGFPSCVDGCAHLLAVLQECHRFAGVFAAHPAQYCATGSMPGHRPREHRSPPPPHARDLERSPHNPGSQPAGCTTQHRAPEPVSCEPRSSDGSPPNRPADHNDQATQSSSR